MRETATIPAWDTERFRQELAGLADPNREIDSPIENASIQESALDILTTIRFLFNHEVLDAKSVNTKLFAVVEVALAAAEPSDTTAFVNELLRGVFASSSRVAVCEELTAWLAAYGTESQSVDSERRTAILRWIRRRLPILPALVRQRYEARKKTQSGRFPDEESGSEVIA